jgi:hypothetical protein
LFAKSRLPEVVSAPGEPPNPAPGLSVLATFTAPTVPSPLSVPLTWTLLPGWLPSICPRALTVVRPP